MVNTLRLRPNRRHFTDDIFKCIFDNENEWITPRISLKFVPKVWLNNIPALVQIMVWHRPGNKPLSEPIIIWVMHICVTRPQWVNVHWWISTLHHFVPVKTMDEYNITVPMPHICVMSQTKIYYSVVMSQYLNWLTGDCFSLILCVQNINRIWEIKQGMDNIVSVTLNQWFANVFFHSLLHDSWKSLAIPSWVTKYCYQW